MSMQMMSSRLIGVDIGSRCIRAAQRAGGVGGSPAKVRVCSTRRHGENDVSQMDAEAIADLIVRGGFSGRRIVIAAPDADVTIAKAELPPPESGAPLDRLALQAVAEYAGLTPDKLQHAWWMLPAAARSGKTAAAMVAAIPRARALELVTLFEDAGLEVAGIDLRMYAAVRAAVGGEGTTALDIVLDLGGGAARAVVSCDGVPVYERVDPYCAIDEALIGIADEFQMDPDRVLAVVEDRFEDPRSDAVGDRLRAVISERAGAVVRTALKYATHVYPNRSVGAVQFLGGGSAIPGVADELSTGLGMPVACAGGDLKPGYQIAEALSRWEAA